MSKPHLSADSLTTIQRCMDDRLQGLTALHWRAVAFGATDPLYTNIQLEVAAIEKARGEACRLFEAQFPPVKPKPEPVTLGAIHIEAWD